MSVWPKRTGDTASNTTHGTAAGCNSLSGRLYGHVYIPIRFENMILRHVLLNCVTDNKVSPILLLQGSKGEGKTFMVESVLKGNNIFFRNISSSTLAGKNENDAAQRLLINYNACDIMQERPYTCLVIDDFHLSIAATMEHSSHTTNAENLAAALMNLADQKNSTKAPIIIIGNNFTNLYAPLARMGRMRIETWKPTVDEKAEIVRALLKMFPHDSTLDNPAVIQSILNATGPQYIGLYHQAMQNLLDRDLENTTCIFAENKGMISPEQVMKMIREERRESVITKSSFLAEIQKLINTKLEELDK